MDYRILLGLITLLTFTPALGQDTALSQFIDCVALQYGPDDLLINGRPYIPTHLKAEGHPYFQTETWTPGVVHINGKPYPAERLKYNLFTHQLVIEHVRPNGTTQKAVLSDVLVDSFYIGDHLFVNPGQILSGEGVDGYPEQIFDEQLSFFRLQRKVFSAPTNGKPYGAFRDLRDVFFMVMDDRRYEITRRRDFLACFPDHKPQIKKYMRKNLPRWKKISKPEFTQLLNFCYDQI